MDADYSDDKDERDLQLEARAHIVVQNWLDDNGRDAAPFSTRMICETHKRFYELLPRDLLLVQAMNSDEKLIVEPGAVRTSDVRVGRHVAISPGSVPRFLEHMEQGYSSVGRIDEVLISACGHHRLLWVHPFLDGNGRVARLLSHAALRSALRTRGLWSVARALARRKKEYRALLQSCDEPLRSSGNDRGALSEKTLENFTEFFLETCIAEVDFMSGLMEPRTLQSRVLTWAREEMQAGTLPPRSEAVLMAILYRGKLDRAEIPSLVGTSERSARRLTAALIKFGVAQSETSRTPLSLALPVGPASRFLPGLFREMGCRDLDR
nr:Fic family protein [Rhizobium leguminosarum]